tara:strand:+ start:234 stop:701 length:468 start_codon:yes stop_codon:yes gene_type:complete
MNQYTELLYYIKALGEADPYINTILKGNSIDLNKIDIYPLLNIVIDAGSFPSGGTIAFDVVLECVAIRDINKEVVTDKFWEISNEVDNHNETLATLNRMWRSMNRDFTNNNITASDNPSIEKITGEKMDILDGWSMTFTVEMPNVEVDLCKDLLC